MKGEKLLIGAKIKFTYYMYNNDINGLQFEHEIKIVTKLLPPILTVKTLLCMHLPVFRVFH